MSKIFCYHKGEGLFWFRVFGRGLSFDVKMKFSVRIGKTKYVKIGKWVITTL